MSQGPMKNQSGTSCSIALEPREKLRHILKAHSWWNNCKNSRMAYADTKHLEGTMRFLLPNLPKKPRNFRKYNFW